MRTLISAKLEQGRITEGAFASDSSYGLTGAFIIFGPCGAELKIVASGDCGWEHVSVSTRKRPPNWQEMCFVKELFWSDDECVVQFHPPKKDYVNCHPYCLHLWRNINKPFETPPTIFVGPQQKPQ